MADKIYAPSHFLANTFNKFGFGSIEVQNLGMEPVVPLARQPHDYVRFGYIGQISVRKGANILLDAFEKLSMAKCASLDIYGESHEQPYLELIKKRINTIDNAVYRGSYKPDELPSILSGIDVLVVPSLWENYPLVVQEAFQNKVPVIVSNAGGFPEVVIHEKNGLLFKVEDSKRPGSKDVLYLRQSG